MATRRGTARDERLDGTAASDTLLGLAGKDKLFGLAGNDLLDGGKGADVMSGGRGNDTYVVDDAGDRVIELRGQGTDTVRASISHTLAAEVENLILTGTAAASGTGNGGDNQLTGNSARNTLNGGAGNDLLNGGGGADSLLGGAGDDIYVVNSAAVRIFESGNGYDTVRTSVSYTLPSHVEKLIVFGDQFVQGTGNSLDNLLVGSAVANTLIGGAGNDTLDGAAGNDTLRGGTGNDVYVVDSAGDVVLEDIGQGSDTIRTALDKLTLPANVENVVLLGTRNLGATGNDLANHLSGNSGDNRLFGLDGDDVIDGAAGADRMAGGAGNDTYVVDNVGDVVDEVSPVVTNLLVLGFEDLAGTTFVNPGYTVKSDVFSDISEWSARDAGTLKSLKGLASGDNRGLAVAASSFDAGSGDGNAAGNEFLFTVTVAAQKTVNLSAFSFREQGSNGPNGSGPSSWRMFIDNTEVASGTGTLGSPGGLQSGDLHLSALTGTIHFRIAAEGASLPTATWRIDEFTLGGSVAVGGDDTVKASIDYTLPDGVENLLLTGSGNLHGSGNAAANLITGNAGANLLDGAGGADRVIGGAGDDVLVYDPLDTLLDGGHGSDTLRVDGSGVNLDLRLVDDTRLLHIDHIALGGSGNNTLALNLSDVLALGADSNTLRVSGEAGDTVVSSGQGWMIDGAVQTIGAAQYQLYSAGVAHLLVDVHLTANLS